MASVNRVILLGNLGKDPEVRNLESGKKVANFSLATAEKYGDKETTTWHTIVLWEKLAEVAEKYLKKGAQVYVEGKISNRSYDDKDGVKKYITEIIGSSLTMIGSKQGGSSSSETPAAKAEGSAENYMNKNKSQTTSTDSSTTSQVFDSSTFTADDDLPF